MSSELAIIIPAYKAEFLRETLSSLEKQSVRGFRVYVGDDCSPSDIEAVVNDFKDTLDITFKRFGTNLGGGDLVSAWERCIAMSSEEWIWLFSDDDLLPGEAVANFYNALCGHPQALFFRMPLAGVDGNGKMLWRPDPFNGDVTGAEDMLCEYMKGKRPSAACEYIFKRSIYDNSGMVHFPLAWCSDTASWYKFAKAAGGVVNISGAAVCWRNADGVNISNSDGFQEQKMEALIQFVSWLKTNYAGHFNKDFKSALRSFIETNLSISFAGSYSDDAIRRLCSEFARISPLRAYKLSKRYHKI